MPPKSRFWEFFERLENNEARCRSCHKIIKTCGNTTNLKLHIEKMHSSLLGKNSNEENTVHKTGAKRSFKETFVKPVMPTASTSAEIIAPVSALHENSSVDSDCSFNASDISASSIRTKIFQPTLNQSFRSISEFSENGAKGIRLTNAILFMICKDSQPFQMVENEGFLNLMKAAAPLYKVPSRHTFKKMLENRYEVTQNLFKNKIKGLRSNITLTTDIWTDTMQTRSFLGVTIHFYDEERMAMASVTLGVYELAESHTAEYIGRMLLQTCHEWCIDPEKVSAVVTDGGANVVKAVDISFGKKCHIICFAHLINLVAQKSIAKTKELPELIGSVKRIVTWFKHSVVASDELRKHSDLKLIQEVSTRWNSTFYMVERFLELRPTINQIVNCHTSAPPMITAKGIEELTEIFEVLRPIEVATKEICGEDYVTSSKVIPITRMLNLKMSNIKTNSSMGQDLKQNIMTEISKRLLPSEHVQILALSTLLDPRFKNIHFQDRIACSKAIKLVKELLTTTTEAEVIEEVMSGSPDPTEEFNLWSEHYKLVNVKNSTSSPHDHEMPSELSYFLKNTVSDLKQDPIQVWNNVIGSTYPKLKIIALKYLSTIATSTPSERLFSKAGSTLYQQRNRLKGSSLSKLLFLQSIDKKYWNM